MNADRSLLTENPHEASNVDKVAECLVLVDSGKLFTTSLIVAEVFEKNHKDVLKAISNLECSAEFNERNFAPVEYLDAKGESRPSYNLTRDGFSMLVMGFTGKKAMAWKEKFLEAFNMMETRLRRVALESKDSGSVRRDAQLTPRNHDFPRKKCTKRQVEALRDLITFWSYVEGCLESEAEALLLHSLRVPALAELQQSAFLEASRTAWRFIFQRSDFSGASPASVQSSKVLQATLRTWEFYCDHKGSDIADYVCNACKTSTLQELGEKDTQKAILATFMGFVERFPGTRYA